MTATPTRDVKRTLARTPFKTSRLLEFCSQRELVAQTGQAVPTWPLVVLKELVDNALDAVEEANGEPPLIKVAVSTSEMSIAVTDNGPGIRPETVEDLLDFSSRTSSKEAYVSPTRGQQGNALSTILPMPFALANGNEATGGVSIEAHGVHHEIRFRVDPVAQRPVVELVRSTSAVTKGTRVTVYWPLSASSLLVDAKWRFLQIAFGYACLNPHMSLDLEWTGEPHYYFPAAQPDWIKWGPSDPTCPHWYDQQRFERLIGACVVHDRASGRERTIRDFMGDFRGLSSTLKQKRVLEESGSARAPLASLCSSDGFDEEKISALLAAMKAATKATKPEHLGVIGKAALFQQFTFAHGLSDTFTYSKEGGVTDGVPWIVECAFGMQTRPEASRLLITGINWSPAIANPFRALGSMGSFEAILEELRAGRREPVILILHLACARVEYTDRGKSAVALPVSGEGGVENAVVSAVTACTKRWTKQRKAEERRAAAAANRLDRMTSRRGLSLKDAAYDCMEQAYMAASANGTLPAHARQVMYQARPIVQEATGNRLDDQYFTQTLLPDYIRDSGVTWDIVFDERGHFIEPHTDRKIGLGTIAVRDYLGGVGEPELVHPAVTRGHIRTRGADCRFGAVLFIEKEGFLPLFNHVRLCERYDIAVMSTKGVSNTAARRLVDDTCVPNVPLLVLHDFDKAGFSILGTLRNDTRRFSFTNEVTVIDLGLRLDDVRRLGLEAEAAADKGSAEARRGNLRDNGATEEEIEFLLHSRVELNALPSDTLIEWIEAKLTEHGIGKVIPTSSMLADVYRFQSNAVAIEKMLQAALVTERMTADVPVPDDLGEKVRNYLDDRPHLSWDDAVAAIVKEDA